MLELSKLDINSQPLEYINNLMLQPLNNILITLRNYHLILLHKLLDFMTMLRLQILKLKHSTCLNQFSQSSQKQELEQVNQEKM